MTSTDLTTYEPSYANSHAFVIGLNKYQHVTPLDYALNDANAVAEKLEQSFGFPAENITVLKDEEATAQKIRECFLEYTQKTEANDRLLVFFAGHGYTHTSKRGEVGYLVPYDGTTDNLASLVRWDEFTRNADLVPAKHILFVMDACYSGLAFQRSGHVGSMRFMGDMLRRYSRQVLTAGKADEVVSDGNGSRPKNSIFTSYFLDALDGAAMTDEKVLTANGVMSYVYKMVSGDQYSKQTPHYGNVDGDGDFIFDTQVLDEVRKEAEQVRVKDGDREGEGGTQDVLVKTSQHYMSLLNNDDELTKTTKELLAEPKNKILLNDLVTANIKQLLEETDVTKFPVNEGWSEEEFAKRVALYEEATSRLQTIAVLLSRWGNTEQLIELKNIITRLAETDKGDNGKVAWINLGWYPLHLIMYSAGISALYSENYDALKIVLETKVQKNLHERDLLTITEVVGTRMADLHDMFKTLPEMAQKYVPRSEHLFTTLQPKLEDILFMGRSYEDYFDRFECLVAVEFASQGTGGWGPPGRFGWKYDRGHGKNPYDEMVAEGEKMKEHWPPIKAGMFGASYKNFFDANEDFKGRVLKNLHWW